jgi:signal transduction histidine kinase
MTYRVIKEGEASMTSVPHSWGPAKGGRDSDADARAANQVLPDELSMLLRITDACASGSSVDEILDSLYVEIQALIPFDRLEYAVIDDTGYSLITKWFKATYNSTLLPVGTGYRRSQSVATAPKYRVTTVDNDMPTYALDRPPDHPVSLLVREGIKSSLSCPLIVDDEMKGFLFFNRLRHDGYTKHHADLIQLIAGHLASVIEQSRLNAQLQERNDRLQELEQSRLEFIASISHELRTPLTAVVGFASEMQDRVEDFSAEELRQFAGVIAAQSNEVAGIVEDLLVITRAEAGHLAVTPGPVNVALELSTVRASLPDDRPQQRITMGLVEAVAWADPLRVRQILRNLLSNAQRYGGDAVRVSVTTAGDDVVVSVADNGPGIPNDDRELVFQAYGRSHRSEGKPGSIGLGLTVSRYLAEAMEGSLDYDRDHGMTRFRLRLPQYNPGASRFERSFI